MIQNMEYFHVYVVFLFNAKDQDWTNSTHGIWGQVWPSYFVWSSMSVQVFFWLVLPRLIREEEMESIANILLLILLFQFIPKVCHSICMMRSMQQVTGYIFGTIWWGFALNLIAYFIASHVSNELEILPLLPFPFVQSCLIDTSELLDVA